MIRPAFSPYTLADVHRKSTEAKAIVVTSFSGGGGSSTGHQLAGGRVVLANEFVPEAARTYRANYSSTFIDTRDIRAITASRSTVARFLSQASLCPGEIDILDGSPPCCEFSIAGNGMAAEDVLRPYSDVKQSNIALLPFDFVDLVHYSHPKTVFIENVPGLTHTRSSELFERLLNALRYRLGARRYLVNWKILSANDFGVAQNRKRLIILGIREDVAANADISSDDHVAEVFPEPTCSGVVIRSALEHLAQSDEDVAPWLKAIAVSSIGPYVRLLPKEPEKNTLLRHIIPGYTKKFTLVRSSWEAACRTLVVSGQRPDGMTGILHPAEDRKFTIPELKRLTALPDDFRLTGSLAQAAERICRMVPPPLVKAVTDRIIDRVLNVTK
jgi:DNA-cytosine methyltransferase